LAQLAHKESGSLLPSESPRGVKLLAAVVRDLDAAGVQLDNLGLRRSTLDDVFLALTGHGAEN
jgi:hypothetical protein